MFRSRGVDWKRRFDLRIIAILLALMAISLLVIASSTIQDKGSFFSPAVIHQMLSFAVGSGCFLFFSLIDYRSLERWSYPAYLISLVALVSLFFFSSVQNVHRWIKMGPVSLQPSEFAKLSLILLLAHRLKRGKRASLFDTLMTLLYLILPFFLILKQPDLGTALLLLPIAQGLFYCSSIHPKVVQVGGVLLSLALLVTLAIFLQIIPFELVKPLVSPFLKEYQLQRLNPNSYHQRAGETAIALGGVEGSGFGKSVFTGQQWLPFAHTDSIFPAFAEEFGLVGVVVLFLLFFGLLYFAFQVIAVARDEFGRLLALGIFLYFGVHWVINTGMMSGLLPITGVPLLLLTYGGSSVVTAMSALGILQSIYSRRYMF